MKLDSGYLSQPTLSQDQVAFICDDDLWVVPLQGGRASRLTANLGVVSSPCFSPDGQWIAFCGTESGQRDLYLIPAEGGEFKRITFFGINSVLTWKDNKTVAVNSTHESFHRHLSFAYFVDIETGAIEKFNFGPVHALAISDKGKHLIGRNCRDSARWKRYRGGTAGVFWLEGQKGNYSRILEDIEYNLTNPTWIGNKLYFVSDHQGIAQIYYASETGKNIKRLTSHLDYYVRGMRSNGEKLVYHVGGDIYVCDVAGNGQPQKLDIEVATPAIQAQPRFEDAFDFLDDYGIGPKGNEVSIVARGHLFRMKPWNHGTTELPSSEGLRHKLPLYLQKGVLVVRADHVGEETLHLVDPATNQTKPVFAKQKWGKIWSLNKNPRSEHVVLTNNRNEIYYLDMKTGLAKKIEASKLGRYSACSFSPDGRYLVYTAYYTQERTGIRIYDTKTKETRWMIDPVLSDWSGSFDQSGKYFYFLSIREFYPNYNWTHFDLGFPFAGKPYVITLAKNTVDPFQAHLEPDSKKSEDKKKKDKRAKDKKDEPPKPTAIDWDGLEQRIQGLPVKIGGYISIIGLENKALFYRSKVQPVRNFDWLGSEEAPDLYYFNFDKSKEELFHSNVRNFDISTDREHIMIKTKSRLRLVGTRDAPRDGNTMDKLDGWIDVGRIKLKIDPRKEWQQMYREAWELQREHFWDPELNKIDWDLVYERYLPLLERVRTRAEMSDLLWEMQGELGTSHCYEFLGDYFRRPPAHALGFLGGEFKYNSKQKSYEVVKLFKGDSWIRGCTSPLLGPRAGLKPGDQILAVDGIPFDENRQLGSVLLGKGGSTIDLQIQRKGAKERESISVTALSEQGAVQYRQWVESRKQWVHEKSGGRLGYVHIPDMGAYGYAEFYRNFLAEFHHQGLIVDVRYNGGGHVSQHILKILAQKIMGFDQTRWNGTMTYPSYAVNGPLVALTNEIAGSDGDIFSHTFKLMKLGPLIGKRTWGGVVGINGQYNLRDGTVTTQPEYSFWFKDVGWKVENYGTDPDIEVDLSPMDWARGRDSQLEKAVEVALGLLRKNPPLKPKLDRRPNLEIPTRLL